MTAANSEMSENSPGRKFAYVENNCWPWVTEPSEESASFDPSRLTPKQYLGGKACVQAIILEINGLLAVDKTG